MIRPQSTGRRQILRGMLGGAAVSIGVPFLDCFLDTNGTALAASGAALVPNSGSLSYAASKGGIVGMTKSLAMTCAPNVRVNAIAPGSVNTPLITDRNGGKIPAGTAERYALKRVAEPEEIADAILFLSCVESSFVTGSTLAVDGGRTFH